MSWMRGRRLAGKGRSECGFLVLLFFRNLFFLDFFANEISLPDDIEILRSLVLMNLYYV